MPDPFGAAQNSRPSGAGLRACLVVTALAVACSDDAFVEVTAFGDNPGALRMFEHVPTAEVDGARALVVFLHGCNQTHDAARTSGLIALADQRGVHVVAPEQGAFNNGNVCFNWFERDDTTRDSGEAASIRAMIAHAVDAQGIDEGRVFVAGLSAGAAMTSSMLAMYPEVFAAGAVIAGGPAGCARSVVDAAGCVAGTTTHTPDGWAELARAMSPDGDTRTQWPRVLAMHGKNDPVVAPASTDALIAQWTTLHALDEEATSSERVPTSLAGDATRDVFGDGAVERVTIDGLEHALPIDPTSGCGTDAAFQRDVDLCAIDVIARFFAL